MKNLHLVRPVAPVIPTGIQEMKTKPVVDTEDIDDIHDEQPSFAAAIAEYRDAPFKTLATFIVLLSIFFTLFYVLPAAFGK